MQDQMRPRLHSCKHRVTLAGLAAYDGAAATMNPKRRSILAIATEWASHHGGLSTINRELCRAAVRLGHVVRCLVPQASAADVSDARADGVELIGAPASVGLSPEMRLLLKPRPSIGEIDLVIGHGRVTGPAACAHAEGYFPSSQRIQFAHVAPAAIEWYKVPREGYGRVEQADERERLEVELTRTANLVAAVGPGLRAEFDQLLFPHRMRAHEFRPGIADRPAREELPPGLQCLLIGRGEDRRLKGLDIAARALGLLNTEGFETTPRLVIRGSPVNTGDQLRIDLTNIAQNPGLDLQVKPYTVDECEVQHDISRASVVLMPSRSEGFGLVGLEAIAAGAPVLLSERSGLATLLRIIAPDIAEFHIVPITTDLEQDAQQWAKRIESVLRDRPRATRRANELRTILRGALSWDRAAEDLFNTLASRAAVGSTFTSPPPAPPTTALVPTTSNPSLESAQTSAEWKATSGRPLYDPTVSHAAPWFPADDATQLLWHCVEECRAIVSLAPPQHAREIATSTRLISMLSPHVYRLSRDAARLHRKLAQFDRRSWSRDDQNKLIEFARQIKKLSKGPLQELATAQQPRMFTKGHLTGTPLKPTLDVVLPPLFGALVVITLLLNHEGVYTWVRTPDPIHPNVFELYQRHPIAVTFRTDPDGQARRLVGITITHDPRYEVRRALETTVLSYNALADEMRSGTPRLALTYPSKSSAEPTPEE